MVSPIWKLNQQIFHSMFYNHSDEHVVKQFEIDEHSIKRNILRYFQFNDMELSYPSKQFCVRYVYAKIIETNFGIESRTSFNDPTLLHNNSGIWYNDTWDIFDMMKQNIGDPCQYFCDGVQQTILYAQQELLLINI